MAKKQLNLSGAKAILSDEKPKLNLSGALDVLKKKEVSQPVVPNISQPLSVGSKPFQDQVDTSVPSVLLTDEQKKESDKERIGKRFETTLLDVPTEFGKVAPAMKAAKKVKDTLPDTPEFRRVGEIQKNKPVEMTEGQRLGESLTKGSDFQEITTDRLTNKKTALQKQLEQAKGAFASVQGEDVAREIDMYIQDPESFRDIETNTWLGNAIRTGLLTGDLANAIPTADYNPSQEAIARAADANYKMGRIPQSEAQIEFQKSGFGVFKDPLLGAQWLTETAASSLAGLYQAAKRTVPLSVGAGATAGAAFFGVGAIPGALLGLQSGLGVAGLNLATSSNIIESLNENGVDITNRKELIKAFSDEEKMSEIRSTALKYGVPIMVLDLATAGIAGKLIGGAAGKSIARKIGAGLGEAGIQATGGMIGELSGQALSGQEIDWNEVAAEGVVSLFTDAPDVAIGAMTRDKSSSSNKNIVAQINKFGADDGSVDAKINLDRDLANGTITPEEYEQGVQFIGKAVVANEKIPIGIEGENREKSIELIAKKDDILLDIEKLNKQKEDVDDSFYPAIDEQIKAKESEIKILNKDIQESAKTPTKPITAQPTQEDVLITPETVSKPKIVVHATEGDNGFALSQFEGVDKNNIVQPEDVRAFVSDGKTKVIGEAKVDESGGTEISIAAPMDDVGGRPGGARYDITIPNNSTAKAQEIVDIIQAEHIKSRDKGDKQLIPRVTKLIKDYIDSRTTTEIIDAKQQTKPETDAVQVETAGQVPVLTEAETGQEVEQGKPQPKVEGVTEEGAKAEEVARLRAEEQAEIKAKFPNAEYKADGKIDVDKLSVSDQIEYGAIYMKYDNLISPLLPKKETKVEEVAPAKEKAAPRLKPKVETRVKFKKAIELFNDISATKGGAKKSRLAAARRTFLEKNPSIKYIDDNWRKISDQLKAKGLIETKGNCP